jgi:hypothetical protein
MSKRMHTAIRLAAVGILAVLLTGCIKLNVDFSVSSDNQVSGTIVFAFSKQLLQLTGQSAEELIGSSAPIPSDVPGVSAKPYDDGDFSGQEFTFDGVPLTQFNTDDPEGLNIVRQGDTFIVSGVMDLSSPVGASGAAGSIPGIEDALAGADIRISVTFPGAVTDTNGTVDGTTVTWSPKIGERLELRATAGATGSGSSSTSSSILVIGGIALGVIILIVVVALVMKGRRKGEPVADMAAGMAPMAAAEAPQAPPSMPPPPPPSMPPPAPPSMPPPAPPAAPTTEAAPPGEMPPPPSEGS